MRYFYDTEFLSDGRTIDLISIGLVAEDGRELYLINGEFPLGRYDEDTETARWLVENVVPFLPLRPTDQEGIAVLAGDWEWVDGYATAKGPVSEKGRLYDESVWNRQQIAQQITQFLEVGPGHVELWANYGAFDHVALTQLWGDMKDQPRVVPYYTNDLQQMLRSNVVNPSSLPHQPEATRHHALHDARHLKACYDQATRIMARRRYGPDAS